MDGVGSVTPPFFSNEKGEKLLIGWKRKNIVIDKNKIVKEIE